MAEAKRREQQARASEDVQPACREDTRQRRWFRRARRTAELQMVASKRDAISKVPINAAERCKATLQRKAHKRCVLREGRA